MEEAAEVAQEEGEEGVEGSAAEGAEGAALRHLHGADLWQLDLGAQAPFGLCALRLAAVAFGERASDAVRPASAGSAGAEATTGEEVGWAEPLEKPGAADPEVAGPAAGVGQHTGDATSAAAVICVADAVAFAEADTAACCLAQPLTISGEGGRWGQAPQCSQPGKVGGQDGGGGISALLAASRICHVIVMLRGCNINVGMPWMCFATITLTTCDFRSTS